MSSQPLRPIALQLGPMSEWLDAELERRFELIRWHEMAEPDRAGWLARNASAVRAVVTGGNTGIPNALLEALPDLGIVAINGVGFDKVDLDLARARGVQVTNTPGVLSDDVADLALGMIIALLRGIAAGDAAIRAGDWDRGNRRLGRSITRLRFGIVGLGSIGAAIAHRLQLFGPVAYTGRSTRDAPYPFVADLLELARRSDVLVRACASDRSTFHLVDAAVLDALGPDAFLVNVARGAVVDEAALIAALEAGKLGGAALDVFEDEPHVPDRLRACGRVLLSPHIGSATVETRRRMA